MKQMKGRRRQGVKKEVREELERPLREAIEEKTNDEVVDAWLVANAGKPGGGEYVVKPVASFDVPFVGETEDVIAQLTEAFHQEIERRGLGRRPSARGN